MTSSWITTMATLPPDLAAARVLSAPFRGLSMVGACDGYPDEFFAIIEAAGGQLPCEVTGAAFALLATLATGPHASVLVLHRKGSDGPYDAAGLFSSEDAIAVVERLRAKG